MDRIEPYSVNSSPHSSPKLTTSAYLQTAACFQSLKPCRHLVSFACFPISSTATSKVGTFTSSLPARAGSPCLTISPPNRFARLDAEGFAPCAVVETSPGNYQAWLKYIQPLPKELSTLAAKLLARHFEADKGSVCTARIAPQKSHRRKFATRWTYLEHLGSWLARAAFSMSRSLVSRV